MRGPCGVEAKAPRVHFTRRRHSRNTNSCPHTHTNTQQEKCVRFTVQSLCTESLCWVLARYGSAYIPHTTPHMHGSRGHRICDDAPHTLRLWVIWHTLCRSMSERKKHPHAAASPPHLTQSHAEPLQRQELSASAQQSTIQQNTHSTSTAYKYNQAVI